MAKIKTKTKAKTDERNEAFWNYVDHILKRHNFTQLELAAMLAVSRQTINGYLNHTFEPVNIRLLFRIGAALCLSASEFAQLLMFAGYSIDNPFVPIMSVVWDLADARNESIIVKNAILADYGIETIAHDAKTFIQSR